MNNIYIQDVLTLITDVISNLEIISNDVKELNELLIKIIKENK